MFLSTSPSILAIALAAAVAAILAVRRLLSPGNMTEVTPQEAQAQVDAGALFVDVRQPGEYRLGHSAGARSMPLFDLQRRSAELPKDSPVVVICASGHRSAVAAGWLKRRGFEDVMSVRGGLAGWRAANLPISKE